LGQAKIEDHLGQILSTKKKKEHIKLVRV
jgi:hypothetical protein